MNRIKSIIVDDEILARKRISKLLQEDEKIEVVGEFDRGTDAIQFINQNKVDIVFLDIHMPEVDGFAVLRKLSTNNHPFIIFVTADKESAIRAFEYNAIDYLLKPFRNSRFTDSLNKAKEYVQLKNKALVNDQVSALMSGMNTSKALQKPITDKRHEVDFSDILFVKSDGNYLKLYESPSQYSQIRLTMNELEKQLNPSDFLRIHRSILVNTYFIEGIQYTGNNEFELSIREGILLKSGRSFKNIIEQFISSQ